MPNNIVSSFAKKSGKSEAEVEAMWDEHKKELEKKGHSGEALYKQIVHILKKRLHLDEETAPRFLKFLSDE